MLIILNILLLNIFHIILFLLAKTFYYDDKSDKIQRKNVDKPKQVT